MLQFEPGNVQPIVEEWFPFALPVIAANLCTKLLMPDSGLREWRLGNAGATPLIGVLLGLEVDLLFGAAYLLTRRIWLCTAVHFA